MKLEVVVKEENDEKKIVAFTSHGNGGEMSDEDK